MARIIRGGNGTGHQAKESHGTNSKSQAQHQRKHGVTQLKWERGKELSSSVSLHSQHNNHIYIAPCDIHILTASPRIIDF